ncbi:MAG: SDR family oxidoreductase [Steroidobacteraceae bacterium]|nr:SDR family oxidoreductase [Steroidobacteraceae bacterium]
MTSPATSVSADAPRVAIVTGAARGIGAAIALRLAQDGCDVALLDLDAGHCTGAADAVRAVGRRALAVAVDVADEASVTRALDAVVAGLGLPTVLVNNAGYLRERMLTKTTADEWDAILDVNLRGAFLLSRAIAPHLRAACHGRIVNLSSTGALGEVGLAAYSAAKAGVQGLTRTLALELGRHGVTVNAVAPGFVATAMTAAVADRVGESFEDMQKRVAATVPVGRVGRPEDVANAVAFFVDRRSDYVSGQVLYVAGGPR